MTTTQHSRRNASARILGLCLVAVFAFSVVASSASAAPVFYTKTEVQPGA